MPGREIIDSTILANVGRDFISEFASTLEQRDLGSFSSALRTVDCRVVQRGPLPKPGHSTLLHLAALSAEVSNPLMLAAVNTLDWGQVYAGGGIDPVLAEGMFAAQAAGTYGVFAADEVATGLFLLAPNVVYPLHTHAACEVYHCLAGEIDITHGLDDKPFTLRCNQSSQTPSGRLHALRTGPKPVLLAYVWTGEISAATWWWQRECAGDWSRTAWRRVPGESWKVVAKETVSAAEYDLALR